MKIYIYKEITPGFDNPHFFAYTLPDRRDYIPNSCADTAEQCEAKARVALSDKSYTLVNEVEI